MRYTIEYHFGPYHGTRTVIADDAELALARVRAWVRAQSGLVLASQSYRVVKAEEV